MSHSNRKKSFWVNTNVVLEDTKLPLICNYNRRPFTSVWKGLKGLGFSRTKAMPKNPLWRSGQSWLKLIIQKEHQKWLMFLKSFLKKKIKSVKNQMFLKQIFPQLMILPNTVLLKASGTHLSIYQTCSQKIWLKIILR